MKFSKVDHTMPAVAKVTRNGQSPEIYGVIYDNPEKNEVLSLEDRIASLNKRAQKLYAVLNASTDLKFTYAKEEREFCKAVRREFSNLVKDLVNVRGAGAKKIDEQGKILNNLSNYHKSGTDKDNSPKEFNAEEKLERETLIRSLVAESLRKSFCKDVINETKSTSIHLPNVVEKLILAMCGIGAEISDDEKKIFLDTLNTDYERKEQLENIVSSIRNQNVKVQKKEVNGIIRLQLSNADHKRKKYIFQFMKEFASAGKEEQKKMFLYIKKLIVLFFCGVSKYENLEEKEISGWGFALNLADGCYDKDIKELLKSKEGCQSKLERKEINNEARERIRRRIHESYDTGNKYFKEIYHMTVETERDEYEKASYWLSYIAEKAEQLLIDKRKLFLDKENHALLITDLCDYIWQEWMSFICMKYIDMGKAVYHFAMPDLTKVGTAENVTIGEVLPQFQEGITSFDYERIKAYETLDREITSYVVFAVNNFATAVLKEETRVKGKEDVLILKDSDENNCLRGDAVRRILQFFGGQSRWLMPDGEKFEIKGLNDRNSFFRAVKQELSTIRNSCFHYTAVADASQPNGIIEAMFDKEYSESGQMLRKKYFSNNVPMFYDMKNINCLMETLYLSPSDRPAQIPCFERIFKRQEFAGFTQRYVQSAGRKNLSGMSPADVEKFQSTLYFVLKQIYYYGFLQDSGLKEKFVEKVKFYWENQKNVNDKTIKKSDLFKREYAAKNFKKRIEDITGKNKGITFSAICQQIMTDYNMQNNREMNVQIYRTGEENDAGKDDKKLYEHFPLILYECIKDTFCQYLVECDLYNFLKEPKDNRDIFAELTEKEFCNNWEVKLYEGILNIPGRFAWYTMAHFLNQRQLNHMIGTLKSHIQFIGDIDKREKLASQCENNQRKEDTKKRVLEYKNIVQVLEFAMLYCEQMTNKLTDYFQDDEEYAIHLANYVQFESQALKGSAALKEFCERDVAKGVANGKIGIYYDSLKPIINKNVAKAAMYGNGKLLEACVESITEDEIQEYYSNKENLAEVFKRGNCINEKEQRSLKAFQNQKNRIELTNLSIYMQIINDMMGQLISWAYLRERDLMYYQLGYYYTKIYHGDTVPKENKLRMLKGDGFCIADGAVLYQIAAMNTYYLPVFVIEDGIAQPGKTKGSIGSGLVDYLKIYGEETYYAGRQLFEKKDGRKALDTEHDEIVAFRNYIDHFKYFSNLDRSIMDLYSIMFDNFFSYNSKLHRSVPIVFRNILARYFVIADISMGTKEMRSFKTGSKKNRASITLKGEGLSSGSFTYKFKENQKRTNKNGKEYLVQQEKKVMIDAKGQKFLKELAKILVYSK